MFAFAKKLVSTIEQQASENFQFGNGNDQYFAGCPEVGLRVLAVESNSLAVKAGLESWFDYILKINGYEVAIFMNEDKKLDHVRFLQFINDLTHNKQNLSFQVWSAKGGIQRIVQIANLDIENSQEGLQEINLSQSQENNSIVVNSNPPFANIGVSVQAVPLMCATYTWHILQTHPGSPAYQAGLLPQSDYIIGAQEGLLAFGGEQLLSRVIASRYERNPHESALVLYVYNHDFDVVRPVTIQPSTNWNGQGLLGCDVGYGYLHRIPEVLGKFSTSGGKDDEFLDDDDFYVDDFDINAGKNHNTANMFIPSAINTHTSAPPPPEQPASDTIPEAVRAVPPLRKKKYAHAAKSADIASYFDEETKRSKDLDRDVSGGKKEAGSVPPPPPPPPAST